MLSAKNATLAAIDGLRTSASEALVTFNRESFDLSHAGHAARIDIAETAIAKLTVDFSDAVHAIAMSAIGHDLVDEDFADIIAQAISDKVAEEYYLAFDRQRKLAEDARREQVAA